MTLRKIIIITIHAFIGWALCGVTMAIGMAKTTQENALIIHAIGAPLLFGAVSAAYVKKFNYTRPLLTATIFTLFVVVIDFLVVALLINKSLEMFASVLGSWIPFALIFGSSYGTATWLSKKSK